MSRRASSQSSLYRFLTSSLLDKWFWGLLVAPLLFFRFVGRPGYIPSGSMRGTLEEGDVIWIDIISVGGHTPVTPLQLPGAQKFIPYTSIPCYVPWIQLPMYRLPGVGKIKYGNIMLFYNPTEFDYPIPHRQSMIKRCVGLPGQKVEMKENVVYVGGKKFPLPKLAQKAYILEIDSLLPATYFARHGFKEFQKVPGGYRISTTPTKAQQHQQQTGAVLRPEVARPHSGIYGADLGWTAHSWGAFVLPKKGQKMKVDKDFLNKYGFLIKAYEGYQAKDIAIDSKTHTLRINGKSCTDYTWQEDYYFVLGDNRDDSKDARYLGPIPRSFIWGKARCRLFSTKSFNRGYQSL